MISEIWEKKPIVEVIQEPKKFTTNGELKCPEGWRRVEVIFDITKNENSIPYDVLHYLQQPTTVRYQEHLKLGDLELIIEEVVGRFPE